VRDGDDLVVAVDETPSGRRYVVHKDGRIEFMDRDDAELAVLVEVRIRLVAHK
jgi:hypothetical protein